MAARSRRPPRRPPGAGWRPRGDLLRGTDTNFAIGWKGSYQIDGDVFVYIDRDTARVTTILGYVGWYWALGKGGVQRIAVLQFLQPPMGVVLAIGLLGEPVTLPILISTPAILARCGR